MNEYHGRGVCTDRGDSILDSGCEIHGSRGRRSKGSSKSVMNPVIGTRSEIMMIGIYRVPALKSLSRLEIPLCLSDRCQ